MQMNNVKKEAQGYTALFGYICVVYGDRARRIQPWRKLTTSRIPVTCFFAIGLGATGFVPENVLY